MKNLSDSDIQKILDEANYDEASSNSDVDLYKKVYSTLSEETSFQLPTNFAHSVANLVDMNQEISQLRRERIWMGIGFVAITISLLVIMVLLSMFGQINLFKYLPMVVGGSILVLIIQYLDQKVKKIYLR